MKIISWNVNKKELLNAIFDLVQSELPDILVLLECKINPADFLFKMSNEGIPYFYIPVNSTGIKIFTNFSDQFVTLVEDSSRYSILKISLPQKENILLVPLHFSDKKNWNEESQKFECVSIASAICEAEKSYTINETIVIGDFNMNPFETGMVAANGFHATRNRQVSLKKKRIVNGKKYKFFFNPMWNFYGDYKKARGTYYYWSSEHVCHFWNIFDQIIFRPELICKFEDNGFAIISSFKTHNLLSANGLISENYSDHLPIKATFNLSKSNYGKQKLK